MASTRKSRAANRAGLQAQRGSSTGSDAVIATKNVLKTLGAMFSLVSVQGG